MLRIFAFDILLFLFFWFCVNYSMNGIKSFVIVHWEAILSWVCGWVFTILKRHDKIATTFWIQKRAKKNCNLNCQFGNSPFEMKRILPIGMVTDGYGISFNCQFTPCMDNYDWLCLHTENRYNTQHWYCVQQSAKP